MRLLQPQHIAREFHHRELHPVAQAEVGNFVLAQVVDGEDFPLYPARAEPSGDNDAVIPRKRNKRIFIFFKTLRVNPFNHRLPPDLRRGMFYRFNNGDIRIGKNIGAASKIFPHDADAHLLCGFVNSSNQPLPIL